MSNEPVEGTPVAISRRAALTAVGAVVVVVLGLIGIRLVSSSGHEAAPPVPPPVARNDAGAIPGLISTLPDQTLSAVGAGSAKPLVNARTPALTQDGKPLVLYVGAEWCPYCAAERWALVAALGRFGTFTGLTLTRSAAGEAYPNTPTFSFRHARYRSSYLAFQGVELQDRNHRPLQQMTNAQAHVVSSYDKRPFVDADAGAIPFVDAGGRFLLTGAQYDPRVLGAQDPHDVASALNRSSTEQAKGILGASNYLTAALCTLTSNRPAATCQLPIIQRLQQAQHGAGA